MAENANQGMVEIKRDDGAVLKALILILLLIRD